MPFLPKQESIMSLAYVESKIAQALKLAKGNATRARQQVIRWCEEDQKLLLSITRAHLNGIVAYNIERVTSGRSAKGNKAPPVKSAKSKEPERFGMEILKAVVNSSSVFGLDSAPRRKGQASQQHIDAIKKLAGKGKSKK